MTRPMRNDGCFGMNSKNSMSCCLYPILSFSTKLSSGEKLEKDRYLPISSSLNAILSEFRDKAYKDIPAPKLRENEELLYIPNDPTTIESKHLKDADITPAERKPDVIGVFVPFLRNMFDEDGIEDYDFDAMATGIVREEFATKGRKESCKPTWGDVQQTWELKNTNKKMEFPNENAVWVFSIDLMINRKRKYRNRNRRRSSQPNVAVRETMIPRNALTRSLAVEVHIRRASLTKAKAQPAVSACLDLRGVVGHSIMMYSVPSMLSNASALPGSLRIVLLRY